MKKGHSLKAPHIPDRGDPTLFQQGFCSGTLNLVFGGMSKDAPTNFAFLAVEHSHGSALQHVAKEQPCDFASLKHDLRIPQTGTWPIW